MFARGRAQFLGWVMSQWRTRSAMLAGQAFSSAVCRHVSRGLVSAAILGLALAATYRRGHPAMPCARS